MSYQGITVRLGTVSAGAIGYTWVIFYVRRIGLYLYKYRIYGTISWLLFVISHCGFVTFPCGILGQVWYLIVLIPDLYRLSYFAPVLCPGF